MYQTIHRHVLFRGALTSLAWPDLSHTGHVYSAVDKHNASAVILSAAPLNTI